MVFSSPIFLFAFLPLTLAMWFATGRNKSVLLAASFIFYGWGEPYLVFLLLFVIGFNYWIGEFVGHARKYRNWIFVFGLAVDILLLVNFKYAAFLAENVNVLLLLKGFRPVAVPHIPLPLGISFFTFQALAYLIDIYRGQIAPAHSLYRYALFKSFFPQLIAGPIVRYQQVERDFAADLASIDLFASGVRRFTIGLAKKVVIADTVGAAVDRLFELPPSELVMTTAWTGALLFALQIYFDFSGYSDMAIGLGRMFGIHLPENFNYPYVAQSMQDFWRRWHITLSTWFRDYVYFPLGGNRKGRLRTYLNLALVFALCGLWHGATWSFVVWGLYNGVFLALERGWLGNALDRLPAALRHAYLIVIVLIGWVIFRAPDLTYALQMIGAMFGIHGWDSLYYPTAFYVDDFVASVAALGIICAMPWKLVIGGLSPASQLNFSRYGEAISLAALLVASGAFIAGETHHAFIYFRF